MLLRSTRVTEKIFGSRSRRKKNNFAAKPVKKKAAKAVKNVHSSTQSFGAKQLKQFYKYGRAKLKILNSRTNVVAKINIRVFKI